MYVVDRCRCPECREAARAYGIERRRRNAVAQWNPAAAVLVDAGPARKHLRALLAAGMGPKTISRKTGIGHGSIQGILYGRQASDPAEVRPPRRRITRDLNDRILAVRVDLADKAHVDSTGTARRLQALMAIGWTGTQLADRLGVHRVSFTQILHGSRRVRVATMRAVCALYDDLWDTPPADDTPTRSRYAADARRFAADHGWPPPLAWDDDQIDNPKARPHGQRAA